MSEAEQTQTPTPPTPDDQPPQPTAPEPDTDADETPKAVDASEDPNLGHALEDQKQGVGVAPTEPGDAGEGNPGTHPQTTEEVEAAQTETDDDAAGSL